MNGPQLENGYTRIANELLEALAKVKLNGSQHRIIDVILRNTYGYSKKTASLSDGYLSKATGLHPKLINREINTLIKSNLLYVESKGNFTNARVLGINKNYNSWSGNYSVTTNGSVATNEIVEKGSNEIVEKVVTNPLHKKEILKKDINKKEHEEFFESIWKLYPKKKGKGQVSDNQMKKLFRIGIEEMTRAIERYKKEKAETDMQYWQNGSTFFNSGYIDYLDANYVEAEEKPAWGWR